MSDSIYQHCIKPVNQSILMGLEKQIATYKTGDYRVVIYKDNYGQFRSILKYIPDNTIVSGIVYDSHKTIRFKFTAKHYRGNNLTKSLQAFTQYLTGLTFCHSDYQTEAGKASA